MSYKENISTEYKSSLIKDIVASNFKTAAIFERYGIDFCCKGNRTLETACTEKGVVLKDITEEIASVYSMIDESGNNYNEWELDYLIMYIVNTHHKYLVRAIPEMSRHVEKIASVHGNKHSYLKELETHFNTISRELLDHMQKEELVLFPLIKSMVEARRADNKVIKNPLSVKNPIRVMEKEHDGAGSILENMRTITNNYELPADACNTFMVTYKELEAFEKDLHKHVFLENSILFPKAIQLEERLLSGN